MELTAGGVFPEWENRGEVEHIYITSGEVSETYLIIIFFYLVIYSYSLEVEVDLTKL